MHRFNGGRRRQKSRRDRRLEGRRQPGAAWSRTLWSWALAATALALALPATAAGANAGGGQTPATTRAQTTLPGPSPVASSAASRVAADDSGSPASASAASVGDQTLSLGTGYDSPGGSSLVRVLQRHLALAGFGPGPVDGLYGPLTQQAVIGFQASHGLLVDGIVGSDTWAALTSSRLSLYPGAGYQAGGSALVRALQRRLEAAGYAPGPIDGRDGPLTERAVRRFQAAHGLPVNGVAGPNVLQLTATTTTPTAASPLASPHRLATLGSSRHVQRASHRSGAPSVALLVILCTAGLAAIMLIAAWWYGRRRRGHRPSTAPGTRVDANGSPAAEPHRNVVVPRTGHPATAAPNGSGARDSDLAATAAGQGSDRRDGEARPAVDDGDPVGPEPAAAVAIVDGADQEDDVDSAFNRGLLLEDQRDLDGAIAAYGRADEQGHAAAAANLGVLLEERGASVAAEAAYRRADQRGDATGAFNLGVLLEERGALAEAETAYVRSDERGHAPAASNLGVLLEQRGASAVAEAAYRRADQRGDATGAFNLGVLLEERGALADADEAYSRAGDRGNDEVASVAHAALLELRARLQETGAGRAPAGAHHG